MVSWIGNAIVIVASFENALEYKGVYSGVEIELVWGQLLAGLISKDF